MIVKSWLAALPVASRQEMELPFMELKTSYLCELARTVTQRCYDDHSHRAVTTHVFVQIDQQKPRQFTVTRETIVQFVSEESR